MPTFNYNVFLFLFCTESWSLDIKNYMRWITSVTISEIVKKMMSVKSLYFHFFHRIVLKTESGRASKVDSLSNSSIHRHSESMILRCWQKRQELGACEVPDEVMTWHGLLISNLWSHQIWSQQFVNVFFFSRFHQLRSSCLALPWWMDEQSWQWIWYIQCNHCITFDVWSTTFFIGKKMCI